MFRATIALACAALLSASTAVLAADGPATAKADIKAADGTLVGVATFTPGRDGVLIHIEVSGLTPGWHGLHLHAKGDCSGVKFAGAGSHIMAPAMAGMDMAMQAHGLLSANGPEPGDLPNLFVGADGKGGAEFYTRRVLLNPGGAAPALLDADGSSLVVHANRDDQMTQPTGGSGDRVACGVITP